ncbi:hypothetical protein HK104_001965 [Borealophlyctis nickersoniae]|nr:hypothetical protein HK104_001965 [Borealophlyctis nickersoniae]
MSRSPPSPPPKTSRSVNRRSDSDDPDYVPIPMSRSPSSSPPPETSRSVNRRSDSDEPDYRQLLHQTCQTAHRFSHFAESRRNLDDAELARERALRLTPANTDLLNLSELEQNGYREEMERALKAYQEKAEDTQIMLAETIGEAIQDQVRHESRGIFRTVDRDIEHLEDRQMQTEYAFESLKTTTQNQLDEIRQSGETFIREWTQREEKMKQDHQKEIEDLYRRCSAEMEAKIKGMVLPLQHQVSELAAELGKTCPTPDTNGPSVLARLERLEGEMMGMAAEHRKVKKALEEGIKRQSELEETITTISEDVRNVRTQVEKLGEVLTQNLHLDGDNGPLQLANGAATALKEFLQSLVANQMTATAREWETAMSIGLKEFQKNCAAAMKKYRNDVSSCILKLEKRVDEVAKPHHHSHSDSGHEGQRSMETDGILTKQHHHHSSSGQKRQRSVETDETPLAVRRKVESNGKVDSG